MEMGKKAFIGAAMPLRLVEEHRDWLVDGQRDLEIQDAFNPDFLDGDWLAAAKKASATLAGHTGRRGIHGPFIGYSLSCGIDRLISDAVAKRLFQSLDFAAEIGATHMVVHSPFINFGSSPFAVNIQNPNRPAFAEQTFAHALMDQVVEKAAKQKCIVVIENIMDTNHQPLLDLVKSFDSPIVRMSLDVGHALITQQHGGPSPDQWVRNAGPLLEHLHIQDTDGLTDRHWCPGDGNINWFALFEALATLDHQPRMHLELREQEHIRRGAAYLAGRGFVQ